MRLVVEGDFTLEGALRDFEAAAAAAGFLLFREGGESESDSDSSSSSSDSSSLLGSLKLFRGAALRLDRVRETFSSSSSEEEDSFSLSSDILSGDIVVGTFLCTYLPVCIVGESKIWSSFPSRHSTQKNLHLGK